MIKIRKRRRPSMLPCGLPIYVSGGRYPDLVRESFMDGTTVVYKIAQVQPVGMQCKGIITIREMTEEEGEL